MQKNTNSIQNGTIPYAKKDNCCGCGACAFVCPVHAIEMTEDEDGFIYPHIQSDLCISCGKCERICAFGKELPKTEPVVYAGVNQDETQLERSSSGGIFSAVSTALLKKGFLICGAEMERTEDGLCVRHSVADTQEGVLRMQGSKYVQSDFFGCLPEIKKALEAGKNVLVTGTPCQIAAVKKLFDKYSKQLFTIDLVCHGVPSQKMFKAFIEDLEKKNKGIVREFLFRDKTYGWGKTGSYSVNKRNGIIVKQIVRHNRSPYYRFFMDAEIFRDNCYSCPYATTNRVGDLSLGDYWGVGEQSPEILTENGGPFTKKTGISCIFVNNENGRLLLELAGDGIEKTEVSIDKVVIGNPQLREPVRHTKLRSKIMKTFSRYGYKGVKFLAFTQMCRRVIKRTLRIRA